MRKILSILVLATCASALAQVSVEITLEQDQVLRSESLPVRVRISNSSGQALRLGTLPDWLTFSVDTHEGKAVTKAGDVPLPKPFTLESAKTVSLRADLMPSFPLAEAGRYTVSARLRIPQLEREVIAEARSFDVVSGIQLWERDFGVPGQTPPEVRRYTLLQATFLKQPRLFVRVTGESDSRVIRVTALDEMVSFSNNTIEPLIDKSSHLHVLFQNGRNTFAYSMITPDGEQLIRQTHEQSVQESSRPRLRAEDDGRVVVVGGQRRVLLSDLPPPRFGGTNGIPAPR